MVPTYAQRLLCQHVVPFLLELCSQQSPKADMNMQKCE